MERISVRTLSKDEQQKLLDEMEFYAKSVKPELHGVMLTRTDQYKELWCMKELQDRILILRLIVAFATIICTVHTIKYGLEYAGMEFGFWQTLLVLVPCIFTIGLDLGVWVEMNVASVFVKCGALTVWGTERTAARFMWHPVNVIYAIYKNNK